MNTPLNRQLDLMVECDLMKRLAIRLALALADEVVFHGEGSAAEESLAALSEARDKLSLQAEFEQLDSLRGEKEEE